MIRNRYAVHIPRIALTLCLTLGAGGLAHGADNIEFLLFPQVGGAYRSGLESGSGLETRELDAGVDIFLTADYGRLRLLGEFLWSDEMRDMERLQLGWLIGPDTTLWLGRYHNPLGYWNTQYHHGSYMQTSLSRPEIVRYDDDGGMLPTHATGLLLEGLVQPGSDGWRYVVGLGAGPGLDERLEPLDILDPRKGEHGLSAAARLSYLPDAYGFNEAGMFAGYTRIPGNRDSLPDVDQKVYGAFVVWGWQQTRTLGAVFYLDNRLDSAAGNARDAFGAAYLQLEYDWRANWTFYGRVEGSNGEEDDPYLARFPDLVRTRGLGGLRYDFLRRYSFKIELSRNRTDSDRYNQISAQWNAVFP